MSRVKARVYLSLVLCAVICRDEVGTVAVGGRDIMGSPDMGLGSRIILAVIMSEYDMMSLYIRQCHYLVSKL